MIPCLWLWKRQIFQRQCKGKVSKKIFCQRHLKGKVYWFLPLQRQVLRQRQFFLPFQRFAFAFNLAFAKAEKIAFALKLAFAKGKIFQGQRQFAGWELDSEERKLFENFWSGNWINTIFDGRYLWSTPDIILVKITQLPNSIFLNLKHKNMNIMWFWKFQITFCMSYV